MIYESNIIALVIFFSSVSTLFFTFLISYFYKIKYKRKEVSPTIYKKIYDNTYQFIGLLSTDGVLLDANLTSLKFAGVQLNDVLGKYFWEGPWWRDSIELQERLKKEIENAKQTKKIVQFIATHPSKDGKTATIDFSLRPVLDDNNEVIYIIPEGRDISDFKRLEEHLGESERTFHDLFSYSPDPCWIISDGKFIFCNKAAVNILGYDNKDDLLEVHPANLSPEFQENGEPSFQKANRMINLAFEKGVHRFEWLHKKKSGVIFPVEVTLARIQINQQNLLYCIWRDITEQKQNEEKIKKILNDLNASILTAEAASRSKSNFICNVSHEIRTPLNSILGLAQSFSLEELSDVHKSYIDTILKSGNGLLELINDILEISTIDSGNLKVNKVIFSLEEEMKSLEKMFTPRYQEKKIKLLFKINEEIPSVLKADKKHLRQILINLIGNALKFTKEGEVSINISIKSKNSKELIIKVVDTGIGIPKEKLEYIFNRFGQIDEENTRQFGGTGLGLSICKELIKLMGGTLEVDSILKQGSTFTLYIPFTNATDQELKELQKKSEQAKAISILPEKCLKILAVDDSEENLQILTLFLNKTKHHLTTVTSAIDAYELIQKNEESYDIIFMDIQMPDIDGVQAMLKIREIQNQKMSQRSYIMALTAHVMEEEKRKYLSQGFDDHFPKPILKKVFLDKISELSVTLNNHK
jgi:PAS domain S-box-containing protein